MPHPSSLAAWYCLSCGIYVGVARTNDSLSLIHRHRDTTFTTNLRNCFAELESAKLMQLLDLAPLGREAHAPAADAFFFDHLRRDRGGTISPRLSRTPGAGSLECLDPVVSGFPDLEAVRWVPGLDVLLVTNETTDQLLVVSPDSLELLATASLVFTSGLTPVPIAGGDGMEGLAVTGVTDRTVHLVLANQNDPHCLYVAELTLPNPVSGALTATVLAAYPQPAFNLSDVMLDWGSRRLFNVHGYGNDRLVRLDTFFSETSEAVALPLSTEGATLLGSEIWASQDLGGIMRAAVP